VRVEFRRVRHGFRRLQLPGRCLSTDPRLVTTQLRDLCVLVWRVRQLVRGVRLYVSHLWDSLRESVAVGGVFEADVEVGDEDIEAGEGDVEVRDALVEVSEEDVEARGEDVEAGNEEIEASGEDLEAGEGAIEASGEDVEAGEAAIEAGEAAIEAGDAAIEAGDAVVGIREEVAGIRGEDVGVREEGVGFGDEVVDSPSCFGPRPSSRRAACVRPRSAWPSAPGTRSP